MVISLDNEISSYEPFGRTIIDSILNDTLTPSISHKHYHQSQSAINHNELSSFNNDFTTIELDQCKDLFRSFIDNFDSVNINNNDNDCRNQQNDPYKCNNKYNLKNEFWHIRQTSRGEEEIYVRSNTLILSHRSLNNNTNDHNFNESFLDKTLTFNSNIIDAIWCNFIINDRNDQNLTNINNNNLINMKKKRLKIDKKIMKTICVLDENYCLHIISDNGNYYQKNLPFRIRKMIAANDFGLLFERQINYNDYYLPVIYILTNPLNDLSPVLMITKCHTNSNQNHQLKLIDIIIEKNLAIFHSMNDNCHHIFRLRSIRSSDKQFFINIHPNTSKQRSRTMEMSDNSKKLYQPQQSGPSSSISRSLSNNFMQQMVQATSSGSGSSSSTAMPLVTSSPTIFHSPLRNSSASASATTATVLHHHKDKILINDQIHRTPSPNVSNLISSRMDSPLSPNPLSNNNYNLMNQRLTDLDIEMYLDANRSNHSLSLNLTGDTPNMNRILPMINNSTISSINTMSPLSLSSSLSSMTVNNDIVSGSAGMKTSGTPTTASLMDQTIHNSSTATILNNTANPLCTFELVMEYIWSDNYNNINNIKSSSTMMATKTYVTNDFLGQNYLALIVPIKNDLSMLKLIKFDQVTDDRTMIIDNDGKNDGAENEETIDNFIFTTIKTFNAIKDAQTLRSLNMMIIIDETNTLNLYSGIYKVAIIQLQQQLQPHPTSSSIMSYCMLQSNTPSTSVYDQSTPAKINNGQNNVSKLLRSSLKFQTPKMITPTSPLIINHTPELNDLLDFSPLPNNNNNGLPVGQPLPSSTIKISNHFTHSSPFDYQEKTATTKQLSMNFGKIIEISDVIDNCITIVAETKEMIDNSKQSMMTKFKLYRLKFPQIIETYLVNKCLSILKEILPNDIIIQLIIKWYLINNLKPNNNNNANVEQQSNQHLSEYIKFKILLLTLIGFDNDSMKQFYLNYYYNNLENNQDNNNQEKRSSLHNRLSKYQQDNKPCDSQNISFDLGDDNDNDDNQNKGQSNPINNANECKNNKKIRIDSDYDYNNDNDFYELLSLSENDNLNLNELINDGQAVIGDAFDCHSNTKSQKHRHHQQSGKSSKNSMIINNEHFQYPNILYPYTPSILCSLHLLYEDLKLIEMNWKLCKQLIDLLYILSMNLNLKQYQNYYLCDYEQICRRIQCNTADKFSMHKDRLIFPPFFEYDPPSILSTLNQLLLLNDADDANKSNMMKLFPYIGSMNNGNVIITPNIFNMIILYRNLHTKQLIHPNYVLKSIGDNQSLQNQFICRNDNNFNLYINMKKFRQLIEIYDNDMNNDDNNNRSNTDDIDDVRMEKCLLLMSTLNITRDYLKQLAYGLALPLWNVVYYYREKPKNDWCQSIYSLIDRNDLSLLLEQQLPSEQHDDNEIINNSHHKQYCYTKYKKMKMSMMMQNSNQTLINDDNNCNDNNDDHNDAGDELSYFDMSVLRLLFPNDQRLNEAYKMLLSSKPIIIDLKQEPGLPDSEFIEEQEKHLLALSFRTMALPLGRGMVTLRSYNPTVIERFPIPSLVLYGKIPPKHLIHLSHIDVPPNMNVWPLFHNGVSAGLRISSSPNRMVDSSWILYNKPSNNQSADDHYEHAGFLLALGLNGLLDNLSIMHLHDYLSKGNDLTKVAILLGLSASRRGTMDSTVFALLGIHLEGLLPSTSTELDVSPIVRVAAVLGTGLLFQSTGNRYIAEVMLTEIGRPPGPEMEHYIDRESYALSAGLAFGLVTLGRGNQLMNVTTSEDISIPNQLNHYMLGVHKRKSTLQKEKIKTASYHIREGDRINADVTSPGATLALGMMFFNTHNATIVQWLEVPTEQNLLEMVRPDFLLLRVLAKNLIMWSSIRPTIEWIESHIPKIIYDNAFGRNAKHQVAMSENNENNRNNDNNNNELFMDNIDYETMTQSYCNIIAGACFSLSLRYAGTANEQAFDVVYKYTLKMVTISQKGTNAQIEQAGRSTIESCINVLIISCSIIMAGTGNVEILRICRYLRSRINQTHVLYGSFMAIHMAIGLLFLGGCRMTLNSSPESIAALICAFFPKYPIHTNDNRYHLQAFRHLYSLAAQPRLLVPTCIDTGIALYAKIRFTFKPEDDNDGQQPKTNTIEKIAPCLLPDLNQLDKVELIDANYWKIEFENGKNFNKLLNCLTMNGGHLYIKRRIKCFSYNKDLFLIGNGQQQPGHFNQSKQSFTLFDFTNDLRLKTFSKIFQTSQLQSVAAEEFESLLTNDNDDNLGISNNDIDHNNIEINMKIKIQKLLYDCIEDEHLDLFIPSIKFIKLCMNIINVYRQHQQNQQQQKPLIKSPVISIRKITNETLIVWQIRLSVNFFHGQKFSNTESSSSKIKSMISIYRMIEIIRYQIEQLFANNLNAYIDDNDGGGGDCLKLSQYLLGKMDLSELLFNDADHDLNHRNQSSLLIPTIVYYNIKPLNDSIIVNNRLKLLKKLSQNFRDHHHRMIINNQTLMFLCDFLIKSRL